MQKKTPNIPKLFLPCETVSPVSIHAAFLLLFGDNISHSVFVVSLTQYQSLHPPPLKSYHGSGHREGICKAFYGRFQLVCVLCEGGTLSCVELVEAVLDFGCPDNLFMCISKYAFTYMVNNFFLSQYISRD
jgi:hypothetical protein